jgi:hypothetical protein
MTKRRVFPQIDRTSPPTSTGLSLYVITGRSAPRPVSATTPAASTTAPQYVMTGRSAPSVGSDMTPTASTTARTPENVCVTNASSGKSPAA